LDTVVRRGAAIKTADALHGYGEFDAGVPKKFVIDPPTLLSAT
ncbi:hypothetical protein, partial [Pseudomonas syringae]